jgi:hypothetical protein
MGNFEKQWECFNDCLEKMGRKITEAQKEHEQLVGTRHRQLDKVLGQIQLLRDQTDFHAVDRDGLTEGDGVEPTTRGATKETSDE